MKTTGGQALAGPLLRLTEVNKRWPGAAAPVLDRIELGVAPGEVISIAGRNGAGKTTLLRIVAGIIAPDAGEVVLGGVRLSTGGALTSGRWLRLGWKRRVYARLSVDDHLRLCVRLALLPRGRRSAVIDVMLAAFALNELRGRRVDRLSMGQRQRLRSPQDSCMIRRCATRRAPDESRPRGDGPARAGARAGEAAPGRGCDLLAHWFTRVRALRPALSRRRWED